MSKEFKVEIMVKAQDRRSIYTAVVTTQFFRNFIIGGGR
jgi:hypothetical protein